MKRWIFVSTYKPQTKIYTKQFSCELLEMTECLQGFTNCSELDLCSKLWVNNTSMHHMHQPQGCDRVAGLCDLYNAAHQLITGSRLSLFALMVLESHQKPAPSS